MKIVLLNNNPVVSKLVALSVQKTSDELHVADNVEAIEFGDYDLFIIDDALYSEDAMDEVRSKIDFITSLFICSKDAEEQAGFTKILKKPFLPTDLVEMLISLAKMTATQKSLESNVTQNDDVVDDDFFNDFDADEALGELEDIDGLEETQGLDTLETLDEDLLDFDFSDDVQEEGVLDRDELQEVQSLLEESDDFDLDDDKEEVVLDLENIKEDDDFDFEDDAEIAEITEDEHAILEDLSFEDDFSFEEEEEESKKPEPLEEMVELEEELLEDEMSDAKEESLNEEDLASQIQEAVNSLSDEDLQTELDEDILLNIGSLTSRDLKLAIGEEVEEELPSIAYAKDNEAEAKGKEEKMESLSGSGNGVEALKKLLKILSDDDVAASLKGMKININITLGDA